MSLITDRILGNSSYITLSDLIWLQANLGSLAVSWKDVLGFFVGITDTFLIRYISIVGLWFIVFPILPMAMPIFPGNIQPSKKPATRGTVSMLGLES